MNSMLKTILLFCVLVSISNRSNAQQDPTLPIVYQPKINQVGYLPTAKKFAVVPAGEKIFFEVVNTSNSQVVFSDSSTLSTTWEYSKEKVVICDFSDLESSGEYIVQVSGMLNSYPFEIDNNIYDNILYDALRTFYFQRASSEIEQQFGGNWTRPFAHADDEVYIHESAASPQRPVNFVISSEKGWYDAGDFNKYVVPAGITVWQLLESFQINQNKSLELDVEVENASAPDIVNEIIWELDWLLSMQDTDGGVYHKLTTERFQNTILPHQATDRRYVVQKSTAATLNFAAVLAKSAFIFSNISSIDQSYIDNLVSKAELAWQWAELNPDIHYDQDQNNIDFSPNIETGDYGVQSYNPLFTDERLLAATELYLATNDTQYLNVINPSGVSDQVPSWSTLQFLAIADILKYNAHFPDNLISISENKLQSTIQVLFTEYESSPYNISLGHNEWDFAWNSNTTACNQGYLFYLAYKVFEDEKYLHATQANLNYVLGTNPLNYCFVTGHGTLYPNNIHHRISAADGVDQAIPGFMPNGPHNRYQSECTYPSTEHAFSYVDEYCSSATNEVSIYGNSALALLITAITNSENSFLNIDEQKTKTSINPYPNPTNDVVFLNSTAKWNLFDINGKMIDSGEGNKITLKTIPKGIYFISQDNITHKIIKN